MVNRARRVNPDNTAAMAPIVHAHRAQARRQLVVALTRAAEEEALKAEVLVVHIKAERMVAAVRLVVLGPAELKWVAALLKEEALKVAPAAPPIREDRRRVAEALELLAAEPLLEVAAVRPVARIANDLYKHDVLCKRREKSP